MESAKQQKLEAAGWQLGSTEEFLGLTPAERDSATSRRPQVATQMISQTIPLLTEPLVRAGLYPTQDQALKHIVLDYIDRRIAWTQSKVRRLEKKHGQSFASFGETLSGRATVADEDEWMEWESLLDMLESWGEVKAEVQRSDVG